jgi:hypothetical protein
MYSKGKVLSLLFIFFLILQSGLAQPQNLLIIRVD